ncbi:MAG: hypothetical protein U0263_38720 [Polyangiaceae bacterium]
MAGYSGTPLPKKLGLVGAACALVVGAPAGFLASLGDLPDSLELRERPKKAEQYDVIVWFVKRRADFERKLDDVRQPDPSGGLWIAAWALVGRRHGHDRAGDPRSGSH